MPRLPSLSDRITFEEEDPFHDSPTSGSTGNSKHVVVVMNGMTPFTMELLQWTLDNVVTAGNVVTLLGVTPWLNIPLFVKMSDFWMRKDVDMVKEKSEFGNDAKNLKRQAAIDLCRKYGVELKKKVVMGFPQQRRVVEQIRSLCPTWVVFDGYHTRNREFYAKNILCDMLMMDDDGNVDIVRSRSMIRESPVAMPMPHVSPSEMSVESCRNCYGYNVRDAPMDREKAGDNSRQRCWNVNSWV